MPRSMSLADARFIDSVKDQVVRLRECLRLLHSGPSGSTLPEEGTIGDVIDVLEGEIDGHQRTFAQEVPVLPPRDPS